ncbi:MAG: ParB/RepB/Spo0J family partition protein [Planctomycetota bacterium]
MSSKKHAFESSRGTLFLIDPSDLVLIDDKSDPRYDPRAELPVNEGLVANIMYHMQGVLEPVIIGKDGDSAVVLDGRQRDKAAREANRRLVEQGAEPLKVPCVYRRGSDDDAFAVMASANAHRAEDSPLELAEKAQRYINMGHTEDEAAVLWGVTRAAVRHWLSLLDLAPAVRRAVDAGTISASAAAPLAKLPREEQKAALDGLVATGKKPKRKDTERIVVKAKPADKDKPKLRHRSEIEQMLAAYKDRREIADTLRWVLGLADGVEG